MIISAAPREELAWLRGLARETITGLKTHEGKNCEAHHEPINSRGKTRDYSHQIFFYPRSRSV